VAQWIARPPPKGQVIGSTPIRGANKIKQLETKSITNISLFADAGTKIPTWFSKKYWPIDFEIHRTSLFGDHNALLGIVEKLIDGFTIQLSCPERAAMEMLFLSPKHQTLYDTTEYMEQFKGLQPEIVQLLLENCNSIKVKRLFLYFVNRFRRGFVSKLDLTTINLGGPKVWKLRFAATFPYTGC
jgi:hypothetical protein